jgi:hypothetical protein
MCFSRNLYARYIRTDVTYAYVVAVLCAYVKVRVSVYWKGMQEHMQDEDVNPIPSLMDEEDSEWE